MKYYLRQNFLLTGMKFSEENVLFTGIKYYYMVQPYKLLFAEIKLALRWHLRASIQAPFKSTEKHYMPVCAYLKGHDAEIYNPIRRHDK